MDEKERAAEARRMTQEETQEETRRMSREDVHDYDGITLTAEGEEERREDKQEILGVHVYSFSFSAQPLWKKILWLCVAGVVMAGFFLMAGFFVVGAFVVAGLAALWILLRRLFM